MNAMTDTDTATVEQVYDAIRASDHKNTWMQTYGELAEHYAYNLPENAVRFDNLAHMRREVVASGSHYFDADAIRFFRGKTDTQMFEGRFWVESRKYVSTEGVADDREYQVAYVTRYNETLSIEKVGMFLTLDPARAAAKSLAAALKNA